MTPDIRAARQALGLSLQGLADLVRITDRQVIRRYEAGNHKPGGPFLVALAYLLDERGLDPADYGLFIPSRAA